MSDDVGHGYFSDSAAIMALQKRLGQFELMVGYVMEQAMPDEEREISKLAKRVAALEKDKRLCQCRLSTSSSIETTDSFHTPLTGSRE